MSTANPDKEPPDIPELVVAIDGPAGSGKSTVARALARELGFRYLDTGAMYRAVTWLLLSRQVPLTAGDAEIEPHLAELSADRTLCLEAGGRVSLGGRDITAAIRSAEVEAGVSTVAAVPAVRRVMRELQRDFARQGPVVAEGRDIATVVFPAARWKFYLDADPGERARRRQHDFQDRGRDVSLEEVQAELTKRDRQDSSRQAAPLRRSEDAHYVDTTSLDAAQVVERLRELVTANG